MLLLRELGLPVGDPVNNLRLLTQGSGLLVLGCLSPEGQLTVLGAAGSVFERTLASEMSLRCEAETNDNFPAIAYLLKGFDLVVENPAAGLARAGWLQAAAQRAARLVCAGPEHYPADWDLLQTSLPCLVHPFNAPPAELRARHFGKPLMALAEDRSIPPLQILRARVAVSRSNQSAAPCFGSGEFTTTPSASLMR